MVVIQHVALDDPHAHSLLNAQCGLADELAAVFYSEFPAVESSASQFLHEEQVGLVEEGGLVKADLPFAAI